MLILRRRRIMELIKECREAGLLRSSRLEHHRDTVEVKPGSDLALIGRSGCEGMQVPLKHGRRSLLDDARYAVSNIYLGRRDVQRRFNGHSNKDNDCEPLSKWYCLDFHDDYFPNATPIRRSIEFRLELNR